MHLCFTHQIVILFFMFIRYNRELFPIGHNVVGHVIQYVFEKKASTGGLCLGPTGLA